MFNNSYNPFFNNNTYGQGYNNQYPQQNYTQTPQQMPQQMAQQQIPQSQLQTQSHQQSTNSVVNTNKIFVNGIEDVRSRIQPPNSDMIYIDNDNPLFYQKIVDGIGKFTLKTFSYKEFFENKENTKTKDIDMSEYVLKSDFEILQKQIQELSLNLQILKDKSLLKQEQSKISMPIISKQGE